MRKSLLTAVVVAAGLVVACGSSRRENVFGPTEEKDNTNPEQGFTPGQTPCEGLECKRVQCEGGVTTTLRGKVYDPAGANPLYNVMVYIPGGNDPDGDLPPFKDSLTEGISCETCASVIVNPMVSALTDGTGEFVLENVPVEKDVPIVVQIGKWRRKLHVDISTKCEENVVPDKTLKLPKNGKEGDMPQIAVTAGSCDALECMLRGIGIDDSEFVSGHDPNGHVHVFNGSGGKFGSASAETQLWNNSDELKKYDIVLLNGECSENDQNKGGTQPGARAAMYEYLNAGGRAFATHYQYTWFKNSPQDEFRQVASFVDEYGGDGEYDVNTTFPKGEKMAEWLKATGASSTLGKIKLEDVRASVQQINEPAVSWIQSPQEGTKFFSFNTPISEAPENQCGRAVFSDLHITDAAGPSSIGGCGISSGGLNGQQKALEFMFFDLSACVTDDKVPPSPPK